MTMAAAWPRGRGSISLSAKSVRDHAEVRGLFRTLACCSIGPTYAWLPPGPAAFNHGFGAHKSAATVLANPGGRLPGAMAALSVGAA